MPEFSIPIRSRGALVKVLVRPVTAKHTALRESKPLLAYLDTGASDTMLDLDAIRHLELHPEQCASLHVLGREDVSFHPILQVEIALVHPQIPVRWLPLAVLGGAVFPTGAVAALGRDFLRHFVLSYDGRTQQAKLCW